MEIIKNAKEYYNKPLEYHLDTENVADCKFQLKISDEPDDVRMLYALSEDAEQFMFSFIGGNIFFIDTNIEDVKNYLGIM
jgi:hypothetical protein